jgi:hypothetical protein
MEMRRTCQEEEGGGEGRRRRALSHTTGACNQEYSSVCVCMRACVQPGMLLHSSAHAPHATRHARMRQAGPARRRPTRSLHPLAPRTQRPATHFQTSSRPRGEASLKSRCPPPTAWPPPQPLLDADACGQLPPISAPIDCLPPPQFSSLPPPPDEDWSPSPPPSSSAPSSTSSEEPSGPSPELASARHPSQTQLCLSVYLSICLSACLPACLPACLCLSVPLSRPPNLFLSLPSLPLPLSPSLFVSSQHNRG